MSTALVVERAGLLSTVQDRGRIGYADIGVGRSGACDRAAYELANRLVGNAGGAAALEVTYGHLSLYATSDIIFAVTGARCPGAPYAAPTVLRAGQRVSLGAPVTGLRSYLAVRGGIEVEPVLGSRSSDLLGGLGPTPIKPGDRVRVGNLWTAFPVLDVAPVAEPDGGLVHVDLEPGPRADWFDERQWELLSEQDYVVSATSNRIGLRLEGIALTRNRRGELASEGVLRGAVQVPPSGLPVLFLADHPITGGYPVIGYVVDHQVDRCAQIRPGQQLRFVTGTRLS